MLWRRHWQEMRWLTLFCAIAILALTWFLFSELPLTEPIYDPAVPGSVAQRVYHLGRVPFVRSVGGYLTIALPATLFVCAILFGIGGPGHERSSGTVSFTLSLPFSRRRLVLSRFLAGYAALAALVLGALGVVAIWAAALGTGSEFNLVTAAEVSCGLIAGAGAVYSFTYLGANVTGNTIRAIATSLTLLVVLELGINQYDGRDDSRAATVLRLFDMPRLMSGQVFLRGGPFPWQGVGIAAGLSLAFLLITTRWVERHDF